MESPTAELLSSLRMEQDEEGDVSPPSLDEGARKDSLGSISSQGSLMNYSMSGFKTHYQLPDSDSCRSVSPSPDVDSKAKTFDFSLYDSVGEVGELSAALQEEKDFIEFMFSLPHIQEETLSGGHGHAAQKAPVSEFLAEETPPNAAGEQRNFQKLLESCKGGTRVGLDHLDNLCRMMEQLGELREQNSRLQRRVQYLEDIRLLQEMHRDLHDTLACKSKQIAGIMRHISDSDLRLDDLGEGAPLFRAPSEDSLVGAAKEDDLLAGKDSQLEVLDLSGVQRYSISEDEKRPDGDKDDLGKALEKERKTHCSAWGKVKNMIITRKESVRKKSCSSEHPKVPASSSSVALRVRDVTLGGASSDPEEYDADYGPLMVDSLEPYSAEGADGENESGLWMKSVEQDSPKFSANNRKPHLTITVPSSENLVDIKDTKLNMSSTSVVSETSSPGKGKPSTPSQRHDQGGTTQSSRGPSNWTKVKQAFLTPQNQSQSSFHQTKQVTKSRSPGSESSAPPSPKRKALFNFEATPIASNTADQIPAGDLELAGVDQGIRSDTEQDTSDSRRSNSKSPTSPGLPPLQIPGEMQKNIADLQKTMTGEFNKKMLEWERLKTQISSSPSSACSASFSQADGMLPQDFMKKLYEWEKIKEKVLGRQCHHQHGHSTTHEDAKMRKHDEEDLPKAFRKKLTEWQLRKALAGKSRQNIEELQKLLGDEFNRKMAEWEKMKAAGIQPKAPSIDRSEGSIASSSPGASTQTLVSGTGISQFGSLARKGSSGKLKKKNVKSDKPPSSKPEGGHKHRDKNLVWLEKELNKIEREKQRLEREKDKYLEREARLERMRYAMRKGPRDKKEIYIKTSTGQFRFEGISQTFTKKLYEWEERRGIGAESSTIALLDPKYQVAEEEEVTERQKNPEPVRLIRSKSESSVVEMSAVSSSLQSPHHSCLSLGDRSESLETTTGGALQGSKAASEPTLAGDEASRCSVKADAQGVAMEAEQMEPYAPAEITRLIDSSGSEDELTKRRRLDDEGCVKDSLARSDSQRSEQSYRCLLQENMTLLGKLKRQEDLCRALETKMGTIDTRMDCVADQHLQTLEKLHRQVSIMSKGGDMLKEAEVEAVEAEAATNQKLIAQLEGRIAELETKGELLMDEKEKLENEFKFQREHESEIAESLALRMQELEVVGARVSMETIPSSTEDNESRRSANSASIESKPSKKGIPDDLKEEVEGEEEEEEGSFEEGRPELLRRGEMPKGEACPPKQPQEKKTFRRRKKTPPKRVQKLHNLTSDLLFQAKRMEQALVNQRDLRLDAPGPPGAAEAHRLGVPRHQSLKGRRSLRLAGNLVLREADRRRRPERGKSMNWASIEAISVDSDSKQGSTPWQSASSPQAPAPQDLLALNAELSRMAKELRLEMMNMWSFRESTSPESDSSDCRACESPGRPRTPKDRPDVTATKEEEVLDAAVACQLVEEAEEVLQSIASLRRDTSSEDLSASPKMSPEEWKRKQQEVADNFWETRSWPEQIQKEPKFSSESLSALAPLKKPDEHEDANLDSPGASCASNDILGDLRGASETCDTRFSDGISTVSSVASLSHSPSPSLASTTSEAHEYSHIAEDLPKICESEEALSDTWRSTSEDDILSSSFEWKDISPFGTARRPSPGISHMAEKEPFAMTRSGLDSIKQDEPEGLLGKSIGLLRHPSQNGVKCLAAEESKRPGEGRRVESGQFTSVVCPSHKKESRLWEDDTAEWAKSDEEFPGFQKASRFSDAFRDATKSHGEATTFREKPESDAFSKVSTEEFRQWQIEEDAASIPTTTTTSSDVFVPTKRTIFTVQTENQRSHHAKATPTFVEVLQEQKFDDVDAARATVAKLQQAEIEERNGEDAEMKGRDDSKSSSAYYEESQATSGQDGEGHFSDSTVQTDLECNEVLDVLHALPPTVSPRNSKLMATRASAFSPFPPLDLTRTSQAESSHQSSLNSPPAESRKRVLQAVSVSSPHVRSMIQIYNERITRNQELLRSPFKSCGHEASNFSQQPAWHGKTSLPELFHASFPSQSISKSQSTSVVLPSDLSSSENLFFVSRSASGHEPIVRVEQIPIPCSAPPINKEELGFHRFHDSPHRLSSTQCTENAASSSMDENVSQASDVPSANFRAVKIREARDEFLARGSPSSSQSQQDRKSSENLAASSSESRSPPTRLHQASVKHGEEVNGEEPEDQSEVDNHSDLQAEGKEASGHPHRHLPVCCRQQNSFGSSYIYKKDLSTPKVSKSSSTGVIEMQRTYKRNRGASGSRKASSSLPVEQNKNSRKLFRLFKRTKDKDRRDMPIVQQLCRQSLLVDVPRDPLPEPEALPVQVPENAPTSERCYSTIPRNNNSSEDNLSSSRSCPSSPVVPHRQKVVANWLSKGKDIFKAGSPGPSKKKPR